MGDEFCSTYCFRRHNGLIVPEDPKERRNRQERIRKIRKKVAEGEASLYVENTEMLNYVVPHGYGHGKRGKGGLKG